jgi:hypothetical protein
MYNSNVSVCKEARLKRNSQIEKLLSEGYSCEDVKEKVGVSISTVWSIKKKCGTSKIRIIRIEKGSSCLFYIGKMEEYETIKGYECVNVCEMTIPFSHWLCVKNWLNEKTVWIKGVAAVPCDTTKDDFEKLLIKTLSRD